MLPKEEHLMYIYTHTHLAGGGGKILKREKKKIYAQEKRLLRGERITVYTLLRQKMNSHHLGGKLVCTLHGPARTAWVRALAPMPDHTKEGRRLLHRVFRPPCVYTYTCNKQCKKL